MSVGVKFWGVRGSIACASPQHVVYGGNTSCVEVVWGDVRIVLDAGTGIRLLGQSFLSMPERRRVMLLTHTHWDHIAGFPFFAPAYMPGWRVRVLAGHLSDNGGIHGALASQMATPMFPVPLAALRADMVYEDFRHGDVLTDVAPGVIARTKPLNHPNGATGYRLELGGRVVTYITDTEHIPGKPDQNVLALMDGADLAIYDSTYTDEMFSTRVGWGHSTWQEAIRLGKSAKVKRLAIFHHDPDHVDEVMARIEAEARIAWSNAFVARDMMAVPLD